MLTDYQEILDACKSTLTLTKESTLKSIDACLEGSGMCLHHYLQDYEEHSEKEKYGNVFVITSAALKLMAVKEAAIGKYTAAVHNSKSKAAVDAMANYTHNYPVEGMLLMVELLQHLIYHLNTIQPCLELCKEVDKCVDVVRTTFKLGEPTDANS